MGLIGRIFQVVGIVILLAIGLGAFLWFTDYEVEAEVTESGEDASGPYVVAKTRILGYEVHAPVDETTQALLEQQCLAGADPCFATYTVQTHVLRVYRSEGGELLFES